MADERNPASVDVRIRRFQGDRPEETADQLAVEEPLEIRLVFGPEEKREARAIAVTMRTPTGGAAGGGEGHDFELAMGFLFTEGVIRAAADVRRCVYWGPEVEGPGAEGARGGRNVVRVELMPDVDVDMKRLERHFFTHSSCGVCGKTTIEALRTQCVGPLTDDFVVTPALLHALPEFLRESQPVFDRTGGLHAAALFDLAGKLIVLREDVGRHNALDKMIGSQLVAGAVPLSGRILLVSGRASFELLQKTIMAGVPLIAAVGAPSSLAVEMAGQFNVTLVGFSRNNRFNVYAGEKRIG